MPANEPPITLVLFCRRPGPGQGKQRLAATLGQSAGTAVAELMLLAALEDAASWDGPVIVSPARESDVAWASALLAGHAQVMPQSAGTLGERLQRVDAAARAAGHRHLLYMGSDAPALGPAHFAAARERLGDHDLVLAAADDGGVTLMGSRTPWPPLADLPWSTDTLCAALAARGSAAGLRVAVFPGAYDVDVAADLARLREDLQNDPRPARQALHRWLAAHG